MQLLRDLFARDLFANGLFPKNLFPREPVRPLLVRVRSSAGAPAIVEVEARWAPSGRTLRRRIHTERGLFLLAWQEGARSVELRLEAAGATRDLTLEVADTTSGAALDVDLVPAVAPALP